MSTCKFIMSGFGGQGIMAMGQLITYAGMHENKHVSWLPSYGPEMRGGAANCSVIISSDPIGAPTITKSSNVVVMNEPSLEKFEESVLPGGNLFINSSLVSKKPRRDDINIYEIPVNNIASDLGNSKIANMVMLGAVLKITDVVKKDSLIEAFKKVYGPSKEKLLPLNEEAITVGANYF